VLPACSLVAEALAAVSAEKAVRMIAAESAIFVILRIVYSFVCSRPRHPRSLFDSARWPVTSVTAVACRPQIRVMEPSALLFICATASGCFAMLGADAFEGSSMLFAALGDRSEEP
jgi:hypothetical protein